ncbi:MAG: nucleotide exchange factor GrpE, partial [Myxococcaceae bacterium]
MSETNKQSTKVNDRRRFNQEGEPVVSPAESAEPTVEAQTEAAPEQEDGETAKLKADLEAARKRVDELARAFQSLDRDREDFKQ